MNLNARLAIHSLAPDRRRRDRIPVRIPTLVETPGYFGIQVVVTDLSLNGFQLNAGAYVPPETLVRLSLPRIGMVLGQIVWAKSGRVGGTFVNPMSHQRLTAVIGVKKAANQEACNS